MSSTAKSTIPVQVKEVGNTGGITNIIDVTSGLHEVMALKSDGTAVTWGYNSNGQLGDNTTANRNVPVVLKGEGNVGILSNIMLMAPGHKHMTAALEDGSVYTWGINTNGELGNDQTAQKNTPICISVPEISVDKPYVQINTLEADEKVTPKLTPGFNILYDEITNEGFTYEIMNTSVATVNDTGVVTSHSEGNTFIKITEKATGIIGGVNVSVMPQNGVAFPQIVNGDNHTAALKADGTVWTWGRNHAGQLGMGDLVNRTEPVFTGISGAVKIAAGYDHTLVLKSDGTVWAFGQGSYGKLGVSTTANNLTAVQVLAEGGYGYLENIVDIKAGGHSSYALRKDGVMFAWGRNNQGQLGDSTTSDRTSPVRVRNLRNVTQIAAGNENGYALKVDGTVWSWGINSSGQVGDGTTSRRTLPVQVSGEFAGTYLEDVIQISSGGAHALALSKEKNVWAWGLGSDAQLRKWSSSKQNKTSKGN